MSAVIQPAAPVRASDAEREEVVARLHGALGEGRLDLAETEARVAAAYAATHRADLPPLLADLPDTAPPTAGAPPAWSEVWAHLVWRARATLLGPGGPYPTPAQCRTAAVLAAVAMAWMAMCAVVGAAVVAA